MTKVNDKMNEWLVGVYIRACNVLEDFKESERGDTNFISVLIILGIVVGVAAVFMGFKDQIVTKVTTLVTSFLNTL